ncbi:MAG: hypothetical protein FJ100_19395 [Deltaproteobacteria bacterium]|nr:hypothetical protein [Deltaproteobacteria bacterium]
MPRRPSPPAATTSAALGLALLAAAVACSTPTTSFRREFWQTAPPDPLLEVDPPALLPADATSAVMDVRGIVVAHRRAIAMPGVHELVVAHDDGQHGVALTLRYGLALDRRVPVERGALVRVRVGQARQGEAQPVRALLVQSIDDRRFWGRTVVAALVQTNALVPEALVPMALRRIQPANDVVYQSTVRLEGQCVRSAAHREFRIATAGVVDLPTLPGSRMVVPDDADAYEVVLGDNRELLGTDCADLPAAYWTLSAVLLPPPPGTRRDAPLSRVEPADIDANALLPNQVTPVALPPPVKKVPPRKR